MTRSASLSVALDGELGNFHLNAHFKVPSAGITALFGPSGCGKTTILRCVAGLEHIPGRIEIDGEIWQDTTTGRFLPAHQRRVGYVFQEASLFQHLSVRDNLLYGARRAHLADTDNALREAVVLLGIGQLLDRAPAALSGGERQRVAVGRALLASPRVLLMDEPLSALDRLTRDELLPYFERLHAELSLPILYVSHDLAEIERLADTLVLLRDGGVVATGPIRELQTDPALPLLSMPEASVVLTAVVRGFDDQFALTELDVRGGRLLVPGRHGDVGRQRRVRIAASDVSLTRSAPTDSTVLNCLLARIVAIDADDTAPQANVILALGQDGSGDRIAARITRKSLTTLGLDTNQTVFAQIKSVALVAARASHGKGR